MAHLYEDTENHDFFIINNFMKIFSELTYSTPYSSGNHCITLYQTYSLKLYILVRVVSFSFS